jgi:hypothetical protein
MEKTVAKLFGAVFILVGLLGFVGNPIVGSNGFFMTDAVHNIVHILLGVVLFVGAKNNPVATMKIVAVIYLLVAMLGFVMGEGKLLGLVMVNTADNWLHLILATVLFAASLAGNSTQAPSIPQQPPAQ